MRTRAEFRAAMECELAEDLLRASGKVQGKVAGSSMLPVMWPGDRLVVQQRNPTQYQPGQIVVYPLLNTLTAHRIVSRDGDHVVTRGDSSETLDPAIQQSEILGEVVSVERRGRRVSPDFTLGRRMTAWLLRRSEFSVRVLLHLRHRLGWAS